MMTEQEFFDIMQAMPLPQPVFMRLYYDEQGRPVCYSMEDLPGNYIDVDAETYAIAPANVRVVNGKLKYLTFRPSQKLVPGDSGTCCHEHNVSVVVDHSQPHIKWSKKIYEHG